jgi:hypothetical protein
MSELTALLIGGLMGIIIFTIERLLERLFNECGR